MKVFLALIFMSGLGFAATGSKKAKHIDPCEVAKIKEQEINLIAENISNINTTSTETGGPYQRKFMKCKGAACKVVAETKTIRKYMPDHIDADTEGYVQFPKIDANSEISSMLRASAEFESAKIRCN
jgi:flagellar basal body rod protein FlgC